eukprot:1456122-Rhodomonas_salina.1
MSSLPSPLSNSSLSHSSLLLPSPTPLPPSFPPTLSSSDPLFLSHSFLLLSSSLHRPVAGKRERESEGAEQDSKRHHSGA